jgi:hypothetical protein
MHVARAARHLDVVDDLVALGIDDDDIVGFLVADENQPGILGWPSLHAFIASSPS